MHNAVITFYEKVKIRICVYSEYENVTCYILSSSKIFCFLFHYFVCTNERTHTLLYCLWLKISFKFIFSARL